VSWLEGPWRWVLWRDSTAIEYSLDYNFGIEGRFCRRPMDAARFRPNLLACALTVVP